MKCLKFLVTLTLMFLFASCDQDSAVPQDPFSPTDGQDNTGDFNPDPDPDPAPVPNPTPTPAPDPNKASLSLVPHVLSEKEITLTYKRWRAKSYPLFISKDDKDCHPGFADKCMVDGQILFKFLTEEVNEKYPKELWRVTKIELVSDFYGLKIDDPSEIICLSDLKLCSGYSLKKYRNRRFWRSGEVSDFLKTPTFANALTRGEQRDHLFISKDLNLDFKKVFLLDDKVLQTLVRKSPSIKLNIGKDIFVDSPILNINLSKRLP